MDPYTTETYMVYDKSIQPRQFLHYISSCLKALFIITARRRFPYNEIKHSQTCGDILAHSSMDISFNLAEFLGLLWRILFFSDPQRFSIGLRSEGWLGRWRTLIFLLLNHSRVKFAVWLGRPLVCFEQALRSRDETLLKYLTMHCAIHLYVNDVECTSAMQGKTSPKNYTTTSVLHSWYGIFTVRGCPLRPPNMTSSIATKKIFLGFIRPNDCLPIFVERP